MHEYANNTMNNLVYAGNRKADTADISFIEQEGRPPRYYLTDELGGPVRMLYSAGKGGFTVMEWLFSFGAFDRGWRTFVPECSTE